MEVIRSRQNPLIKLLIKLADNRRDRLKNQQTILIGTHLIKAAIDAGLSLEKLLVCENHEAKPEIAALLTTEGTTTIMLDAELFQVIEQSPSSSGLMALMNIPEVTAPATNGLCLLLENIQDPGNVGTILRSAAAAGANQIWLTPGCADIWSPKVLRAAMGAHFHLTLIERIDPAQVLEHFDGKLCITTLDQATSLYATDLRGNLVLALGTEGKGISAGLDAQADMRIHIPMADGIESLNVAAAATICLFERHRQLLMQ